MFTSRLFTIRKIVVLLVMAVGIQAVADEYLSGVYKGKRYDFSFHEESNLVTGTYGTEMTRVGVGKNAVHGLLAGEFVGIVVEKGQLAGNTSCGDVYLVANYEKKWVFGYGCHGDINRFLDSKNKTRRFMWGQVFRPMMRRLPKPVRKRTRKFFLERVRY